MEAPWLPTVLKMLEGILCQCPTVKHLIMYVLADRGLKPFLHLKLWLL